LKSRHRKKVITEKFEKVFIPASLAGLARTHKIISIEKGIEIQFMKLCSQIRLDDYKKKRSDHQREERGHKRVNKHCATITE
jgi:hypothetical protein